MKHLKVALLALLLVTSFSNVNAQDENNPWAVGFGVNAVDFYPTNPQTNWGGNWMNEFMNAGDHWNIIPAISRLTVGRYISEGFSFEVDGSFNQISKMGDMEVADEAFWAVDGVVKWSIGSVADLGWWEPYLLVGGGYTWVGDYDTAALNGGLGMNFWFNDKVGLNIESKLRQSFESDLKGHFQHSAGIIFKMGGKDTDGDGIYDKHDACPEVFGLAEFNGCPDTDGDGIIDSADACPNVAGLAEFNGCPDTDGDGIADKDDACPTEKGTKANKGCPDTDGDGVVDKDDACPTVAGPADNKGCPWPDADGDGVVDKDDDCPTVAGPASNKGCPEVTPLVIEDLRVQARSVFFESNKSDFKVGDAATITSLDAIREIFKNYPNAKWSIEGHTDSTGSTESNQKLSEARANSVRNAMIERGMNPDNLTAVGFGESNPIAPNNTKAGRAENRRTEVRHVGTVYEGKL